MSQFDHESGDQSAAANEMVRRLAKMPKLPKPITYDVTIIVRGPGGTMKSKLMKIPRESIFAKGYPEFIRKQVEAFEYFVQTEDES